MEVHHHTHLAYAQEKMDALFPGIFTLSLAVTAGFMVENFCHYKVEKIYVKKYVS